MNVIFHVSVRLLCACGFIRLPSHRPLLNFPIIKTLFFWHLKFAVLTEKVREKFVQFILELNMFKVNLRNKFNSLYQFVHFANYFWSVEICGWFAINGVSCQIILSFLQKIFIKYEFSDFTIANSQIYQEEFVLISNTVWCMGTLDTYPIQNSLSMFLCAFVFRNQKNSVSFGKVKY